MPGSRLVHSSVKGNTSSSRVILLALRNLQLFDRGKSHFFAAMLQVTKVIVALSATMILWLLPCTCTNPLLPSKSNTDGSLNGRHLKIVAEEWPPWFLIRVKAIAAGKWDNETFDSLTLFPLRTDVADKFLGQGVRRNPVQDADLPAGEPQLHLRPGALP